MHCHTHRSFPCIFLLALLVWPISINTLCAQRQMEHLNRGLVAVAREDQGAYVSWRVLRTDPKSMTFNLYRQTEQDPPTRVNDAPIADSTNFVDPQTSWSPAITYFVRPILDDQEQAPSTPIKVWRQDYIDIPIQVIDDPPCHPVTSLRWIP